VTTNPGRLTGGEGHRPQQQRTRSPSRVTFHRWSHETPAPLGPRTRHGKVRAHLVGSSELKHAATELPGGQKNLVKDIVQPVRRFGRSRSPPPVSRGSTTSSTVESGRPAGTQSAAVPLVDGEAKDRLHGSTIRNPGPQRWPRQPTMRLVRSKYVARVNQGSSANQDVRPTAPMR